MGIHLLPTSHSTVFQWVVFVIMAVAAVGILAHSFTLVRENRVFHNLNLIICATAALAYLCMAGGFASVLLPDGRLVYILRYLDWAVTTPLLLLELCLLSVRPISNIFVILMLDELMIWSGMFAELTTSRGLAWGLFAFSMLCFIALLAFVFEGEHVPDKLRDIGHHRVTGGSYMSMAGFLAFVWCLYPLVWILQNTFAFGIDFANVAYGILDVLAKPVWAYALLTLNPTVANAEGGGLLGNRGHADGRGKDYGGVLPRGEGAGAL